MFCQVFGGTSPARPILGGAGIIEDDIVDFPDAPHRAVALSGFDANVGTGAIWRLDGRAPDRLDVPVIGGFETGDGAFHADDIHAGRPLRLRVPWLRTRSASPPREQALPTDGGRTWETGRTVHFARA